MQAYEREQMQHERVYRAAGARAYEDAPPTQDPVSVRCCSSQTDRVWCSATYRTAMTSEQLAQKLQSNATFGNCRATPVSVQGSTCTPHG